MNFVKPLLIILSFCLIFSSCEEEKDSNPTELRKVSIDSNGVKWFATNKGMISFYQGTWKKHDSFNKSIKDLAQSENKMLIAGSWGAAFVNKEKNDLYSVNYYNKSANGLTSDLVYAVNFGKNNTQFFGTDKGLSIINNETWELFIGRNTEEILSQYEISAIETANNGWTYVTTLGGGVSRFKYIDGISGATTYTKKWATGLKSDTVYTVVITADTCQWFGTANGVGFHDTHLTKMGWTHYSTADGLANNHVKAIARDLSGNMWFGTANGLSKFDGTTWINYFEKDGLSNNSIISIAVDLDNSIWICTEKGISNLKVNQFINYTIDDL